MSTEIAVGKKVKVVVLPPYIKTAEPMPMLRPANAIRLGEEGVVISQKSSNSWAVRFEKAAFLIDSQYIQSVD
jgi:Protein of unknown function (DUF3148)